MDNQFMTIENHLELIMNQKRIEEMQNLRNHDRALDLKHKVHQQKLYESLSDLHKMIRDNRLRRSQEGGEESTVAHI